MKRYTHIHAHKYKLIRIINQTRQVMAYCSGDLDKQKDVYNVYTCYLIII